MVKYIFLFLILSVGCAGNKVSTPEFGRSEFEKIGNYVISDIVKPDIPVAIYFDKNFNEVGVEDAKYFVFSGKEFSKIVALSKGFNFQAELIGEQKIIVNSHIGTINGLIDLIVLKENMIQASLDLYEREKKLKEAEEYSHRLDNLLNRTLIVIQGGLLIILGVNLI